MTTALPLRRKPFMTAMANKFYYYQSSVNDEYDEPQRADDLYGTDLMQQEYVSQLWYVLHRIYIEGHSTWAWHSHGRIVNSNRPTTSAPRRPQIMLSVSRALCFRWKTGPARCSRFKFMQVIVRPRELARIEKEARPIRWLTYRKVFDKVWTIRLIAERSDGKCCSFNSHPDNGSERFYVFETCKQEWKERNTKNI